MPRRLIVNADDFGANLPRNIGIVEAHLRGVVTSATVLVGLAAAEDAAVRARLAPRLGTGLHLNLTEGRPIGTGYRTLTGPDGAFWGKEGARERLKQGRLDPEEIRREALAQLDRMRDLGLAVSHVDGHHHVHVYPGVMPVLAGLLRERGVRWIRLPAEIVGGAGIPADRLAALAEYAALTPQARRFALEAGLGTTQGFLGLTLMGQLSVAALLRALALSPEGVTELMVHPGYADPGTGGFSGAEREAELAVITDPALREGVARLGIALVSYKDLD